MKNMETSKTTHDAKKSLRALIKEQKKKLLPQDVDARTKQILEQLTNCKEYQLATRIYTYVNYNQEVNTTMLIQRAIKEGKQVLVPRVQGDVMEFYEIFDQNDLESGAYGILEPVSRCKADSIHSGMMIMPGLAFDRKHHRIGYGGGYYDKYLALHPDFYKIALCFDFQIVPCVPFEEQDIPVDCIISEQEIL